MELDPELVRARGAAVYQDACDAYAANAQLVTQALTGPVQALAKAADGIVAFVAALEIQHRQLDDVADQFNALTGETGLPPVQRPVDHVAEALAAVDPALREVFYAARRSRTDTIAALAAAAKRGA